MTKPRTAGELLSQRPHTKLAADDEDEADDSGDDAEDDSGPELSESGYAPADDALGSLLASAGNRDMNLPAYQSLWGRLRSTVVGSAQNLWSLAGPTPEAAERIAPVVYAGQQVSSHLTQLYAANMGVKFTPFDPGPGITERPGVSKLDVYSRPAREATSKDQLRRLETLANTDLQLAKTRTLFSAFDEDQSVNRAPVRAYRRVTEGEKPCALCLIAAQQLYFTDDLMPIHDNCMCDVELADDISEHEAHYHHLGFVTQLIDIGEQKKDIQTLADADASVDDYVNLTKIEQHGELGPVIRWSGQKFTGPQDLPDPTHVRPVPTISGPGRGHEARLRSNAAKVASQRRQRDNAAMRYAPGHGGLSSYLPPPVPKVITPKLAPVVDLDSRRAVTKGLDFERAPMPSLLDDFAHKHVRQVGSMSWFEPEWTDKQFPEETRRAVLQAFDEILDKHPNVKIDRVRIADLDERVAAETAGWLDRNGTASITFNKSWLRKTPDEIAQQWAKEKTGYMFPSAAQDPVRQLVFHEFGHALDNQGGRVAREDASQTVMDEFKKTRFYHKIDTTKPLGIQNRDALQQMDALGKWLAQDNRVSGYSMMDQAIPGQLSEITHRPGRFVLAPAEAVAQAFSDVELRGDAASDVSKALYRSLIDSYEHPRAREAAEPVAALKRSAVDQLKTLTSPKPTWTAEQMAKEDNYLKNAAGEVILSDEQRARALQLATDIWTEGARVEPAISAAVRSTTETMGGSMSGWDFRQKTGPSLYRKIQAEAISLANGAAVDDTDLVRAAQDIKDAVRYTALMPEEGYWQKGDELRKALESLGATTIKNPVGIPLEGYRGRNMAFKLNGVPFELQVHTELGVATKDEAHQIYNVSRKLKAELEAKGVDAEEDPTYQKMLHDMQAKWDTMPITKGTPVVSNERATKDPHGVLYVTDHTAYYGPTIPNGESPLGSAEMLKRERVPTTRYGMDWLPDSPETKIVAPARALPDDAWNNLPVQHLPPGTPIKANEGTLKKSSIDKVTSGREPFREGYVTKLYQTADGNLHVVDGHTRIAMYNVLQKDMPTRIMSEADLQRLSAMYPASGEKMVIDHLEAPSVTGLTADNKGWGSVAARIPEGTEIKPVYKTAKNGKKQLDVAATWAKVSDETLKENWRKAIRQSAPWAVKAGADWYPGVNRLATKLTEKYGDAFEKRWGIKLTPDLTASFFAAYSENNGWDGNLVGVRRLLDGSGSEYQGSLKDFKYSEASDYAGIKAGKYGTRYVMPAETPTKGQLANLKAGKKIPMFQIPGQGDGWYRLYDFHVNKSIRAMQNPRGGIADLRDNSITAPKPADFGANIAGDYSRATADRWVARILLHTDDAEFAESMRGFVKTKNKIPDRIGYKRMSQALMDIAQEPEFKDMGLNAAAVQAIPWVHVVGPLGSIGEIEDLTSYGSVKAETLRKAAEFGDVE